MFRLVKFGKPKLKSETVFTTPSNRKRTDIGVGEDVKITANFANATNVTWQITSGNGSLSSSGGTTVVTFTADDRAGSATIKATSGSKSATITFQVKEPNTVTIDRIPGTNLQHQFGWASTGFKGIAHVGPDTVNFGNVIIQEGFAPYQVTGWFTANSINANHAPGAWLPLSSTVVAGKGTKDGGPDTIEGGSDNHTPYSDGTLTWAIPWKFAVDLEPSKTFKVVNHLQVIDGTGKMTLSKGGTTVSSNLNDPTTTF